MIDWGAAVSGPVHSVFDNVTVSYQPAAAGAQPYALTGIFDRGFRQVVVLEDGSEAFTSSTPVLGVAAAAFADPPVQSDQFTVTAAGEATLQGLIGATYIVREVRPDSHGEIKLMLNLKSSA